MAPRHERSARTLLLDMRRQGTQAAKNLAVIRIVRAQLETVMFGNRQSQLQCINRIQTQITVTEQGSLWINRISLNILDIEAADDELGELLLSRSLGGGALCVGHGFAWRQ